MHTQAGEKYYYNTVTKETAWDKPAELMNADEVEGAGEDYVWAPDPDDVFVEAILHENDGRMAVIEYTTGKQKGSEVKVKSNEILPLSQSAKNRAALVDDLVLLDDMNPALILHCLHERFQKGKIYTAVGTITISINPYTMLPLYTDAVRRKYMQRGVSEDMPPHV
jgi:myosin heavy subunit